MKIHRLFTPLLSVALVAAVAGPAFAESVHEREGNQQHRIGEGIEDHELTPEEVARLEVGEAKLQWQKRHDRLEHGGHLTKRERERLQRELDLLSHRIHHDRHD